MSDGLCLLEPDGKHFRCPACHQPSLRMIRRACPAQAMQPMRVVVTETPEFQGAEPHDPCVWRGDETRKVQCEPCGDRRQIAVYRCQLFGECTRSRWRRAGSKSQPDRVCLTCDARQESLPEKLVVPDDAVADPPREAVADPISEPPVAPVKAADPTTPKTKIILKTGLPPGDVMTLTAAVESLVATYPGQYQIGVDTPSAMAVWENNPHITRDVQGARVIEMHYDKTAHGSIRRSNQESASFLAAYTADLGEKLGVPLSLTTNRPHLYLSEAEKLWTNQVVQYHSSNDFRRANSLKPASIPYWIVNAGVKSDFTTKLWPTEHYQEVIDRTAGLIQWVQIGLATGDGKNQPNGHYHPPLRGAIDLRGKTDQRELIRLAYHSRGGLGPVTFLQHLMAAFQKTYICLLGGREPTTWVQYPLQHTLHTFGALDCCRKSACWKSRVVPDDKGQADDKNLSLCDRPQVTAGAPVAACMAMIQPHRVLDILMTTLAGANR